MAFPGAPHADVHSLSRPSAIDAGGRYNTTISTLFSTMRKANEAAPHIVHIP